MRYRHVWPGLLLLAALGLLLLGLLRWGDHFLSPGPTGGIHRLLQLWAASRPAEESIAAPLSAHAGPVDSAPAPSVALPSMADPSADAAATPTGPAPSVPAVSGPIDAPPAIALPDAPVTPPSAAETKTLAVEPPAAAAPAALPERYALALGTFALTDDAERVESKLNQAGFSTVRFRQRASAKLFSVHLGSFKDAEEGQAAVERLQKDGQTAAVVTAGRTSTTVRVGEATPLRAAVQLAERLRASGYDAKVVAEASLAGQVSLRHGNFASRPEAEAASREITRLGVPNEVIQIR